MCAKKGRCGDSAPMNVWIPAFMLVAKLNNRRLRLLRFARNDKQTHILSLRGVPIHRDDEAISALATSPFAGMTAKRRQNP